MERAWVVMKALMLACVTATQQLEMPAKGLGCVDSFVASLYDSGTTA